MLARRRTLDAQIHYFDLCDDRRLGLVDLPNRAVRQALLRFTCVEPSYGQQQWRFFAPVWFRLRRQDPKNNFGEDISFDLMKPEDSLVSGRQTPRQAQRMCPVLANRRQVLKNRKSRRLPKAATLSVLPSDEMSWGISDGSLIIVAWWKIMVGARNNKF